MARAGNFDRFILLTRIYTMVVVNYFSETHNMASSFYIGKMHFLLNGKTWFTPVVTKDFERQKRPDFCKNRCNVKPTFYNDLYFKMARFLGLQGTVQLRFYCIVLILLFREGVQHPLGLFLGFSFTTLTLN